MLTFCSLSFSSVRNKNPAQIEIARTAQNLDLRGKVLLDEDVLREKRIGERSHLGLTDGYEELFKIIIRHCETRETFHSEIRPSTKIHKLKIAEVFRSQGYFTLLFEEKRVNCNDTLLDHNMEDGDLIDLFPPQEHTADAGAILK